MKKGNSDTCQLNQTFNKENPHSAANITTAGQVLLVGQTDVTFLFSFTITILHVVIYVLLGWDV